MLRCGKYDAKAPNRFPQGFPKCKATGKICMLHDIDIAYCTLFAEPKIKQLEEKQNDLCCLIQESGKLSAKGEKVFAKVNRDLGRLYKCQEVYRQGQPPIKPIFLSFNRK